MQGENLMPAAHPYPLPRMGADAEPGMPGWHGGCRGQGQELWVCLLWLGGCRRGAEAGDASMHRCAPCPGQVLG